MANNDSLRAGTGTTDITPPIGVSLAGGLRPRESIGVNTPLKSKAVVLGSGDTTIAIISVDLCVLGAEFVDPSIALIEERTGIPPANIMVSASHTHAGPYTSPIFGREEGIDRTYVALLPRYIADSATIAHHSLVPAKVGAASGQEATAGHYRRVTLKTGNVRNTWMKLDPDDIVGPVGEIDPEVGVLLTRTDDGDTLSVVFNYSLHANCHGNRALIGASYPAPVARRVENEVGGTVSYTAGACANINPVGGVERVAQVLADGILNTIGKIDTTSEVALCAKKAAVELPLRDFSRLRIDAIRRDWPEGEDVFTEEWRYLHESGEHSVTTSVQVLAVNDTAFVGVPGELFVELGREIKERSPFEHTYIVELANDYVGYIPTRAAFDEGGYEVLDARSSKVGPEAGEIVVEECVRLLNAVSSA